jgi:hypothetical protein
MATFATSPPKRSATTSSRPRYTEPIKRATLWVFSPGIWWIGLTMNLCGSEVLHHMPRVLLTLQRIPHPLLHIGPQGVVGIPALRLNNPRRYCLIIRRASRSMVITVSLSSFRPNCCLYVFGVVIGPRGRHHSGTAPARGLRASSLALRASAALIATDLPQKLPSL